MDFPLEIGYGEYKINAHIIFEILAFTIGFRYYLSLRKNRHDHINEDNRLWIIIGAAFGAFLGSRLIGALESPIAWFQSNHFIIHFYQSKTIVGGLLGGLFGVEWTKKMIGEQQSSGDLFTFPIILGMMIGRIGCFLSGVYEPTYGIATNLPWGMDLGDGVIRHPTSLYEIIFLGILWISLFYIKKYNTLENGYLFKLFLITYLIFRFFIEYIKPGFRFDFGLTTIQITCLLGILYYYKTIIKIMKGLF